MQFHFDIEQCVCIATFLRIFYLCIVMQVFERGVQAIPLAIDLWLHYIAYVSSQYESDPKLEARMRK